VKYLFILNDPPYGTERSYNGLRLALSLGKEEDVEIFVFLMGDAASCAVSGQNTPRGYYSLERMLKGIIARGGTVGVCETCMDARGIREEWLVSGGAKSTMAELTSWTRTADRVLIW
jgi:uncharacterized protein involved in oxidation of intracellular sulfur